MRPLLTGLFVVALLCVTAAGGPVISEFLAVNGGVLADEDGESPDWVEIHNPDAVELDLAGYHLTDDALDLTQWTFPEGTTVPAGGYLVVFASGKDRAVAGSELHTNFKLSGKGEYIGLVAPDGVTIIDDSSFPAQEEDVSFGDAAQAVLTNLTDASVPSILVLQTPGGLPSAWKDQVFVPGAVWTVGSAPTAVGYDTTEGPVPLVNVALSGTSTQSSDWPGLEAVYANDGNTGNISHTAATDTNAWWQVLFSADQEVHEVVLHNRDRCCAERLRDITVEILNGVGSVVYTSPLLNPGNSLNSPAQMTLDVVADHGSAVTGRIVRVRRTPDPAGSNDADRNVLSLGEVLVMVPDLDGDPDASVQEENLALGGTAYQSSSHSAGPPGNGIDDNTGNYTHTLSSDTNSTWWVDLGARSIINEITLHNRSDCCAQRLRDITVEVLDEDGVTPVFTSELLNPENADGSPGIIDLDLIGLTGGSVVGQTVRVSRTADTDSSGQGATGDASDAAVLALGEVVVTGLPVFGFNGFIRDDIEREAFGQNASAFLRIPFDVADPAVFESLALRMRYDAGFVAYLNGAEVARSNAPATTAWNSTATAGRDLIDALQFEEHDLNAHLGLLTAGTNVLAIQMMNNAVDDPDLFSAPQLVGGQVNTSDGVYLSTPTPGAVNDSPWFVAKVADTDFDFNRGFYDDPFLVEVTSATPGAQIRYTTDGTAPSETRGTIYSGPIEITATTVLRALAYKPTYQSTNVDTHTYIFRNDVIASNVMRTSVTQDPVFGPQMRDALTDLPTISLAFSGDIDRAEKASSIEMIGFAAGDEQKDCGMSRYGSYVTNFEKRNIRLYFRDEYGPKKLRYPLFDGHGRDLAPVEEFDALDLRTGSHDMYQRGFYMSNRYMDDTLLDMGHLNPHGRFVHLYVNGTYWGMYHLRERWNADMHATYLGGDKPDYEAVSSNRGGGNFSAATPYDGDGSAWANVVSLKSDYESLRDYLNMEAFVDFMLLFMSGNSEAEHRAVGPVGPGSGFVLYHNDGDGFTRNPPNRTGHVGPENLWSSLRAENHPDYRVLVADRIQRHFFGDGAMTSARAVARLTERTTQVERAFLAEAARWNYLAPDAWVTKRDAYINNVLTGLDQTMIGQFQGAGLLPTTSAPVLSQHGGEVASGYQLDMTTSSAGTIYYTLDGSDPRLPGGAVASQAIVFNGSTAGGVVPITGNTFVRARTLNGSEWSGMTEAFFTVTGQTPLEAADLVIGEFHYNPAGTSEGTEFIELVNIGSRPVSLRGARFVDGVTFTFPLQRDTVLPTGGRMVLAGNLHKMHAGYGLGVSVAGLYAGQLNNLGEFLRFEDGSAVTLAEFTFGDTTPWPEAPDGTGPSLVMVSPESGADPDDPFTWRSSTVLGGTPGWNDAVAFAGDPVADDDGNGMSNLMDHAMGNTPERGESRMTLTAEMFDVGSGPEPFLTVRYRANLMDPGLSFGIEVSQNLVDWQSGPAVAELVDRIEHGDGTATLTWRTAQPMDPAVLSEFVRLAVERE